MADRQLALALAKSSLSPKTWLTYADAAGYR